MYDSIIFLDVDGVLNDAQHIADNTAARRSEIVSGGIRTRDVTSYLRSQICDEYVSNLNEILIIFNLGIVVSSSWRRSKNALAALAQAGIHNYEKRCLGTTPNIASGPRGGEIARWIKDNNYTGNFVILDDDSDMVPYMDHLVRTDWNEGGLNEKNKIRVIEYCTNYFNYNGRF